MQLSAILDPLYNCECSGHSHKHKLSSIDSDEFAEDLAAMVQRIWRLKGMPKNIDKAITRAFAADFWDSLQHAYGHHLVNLAYDTPDYNMLLNLQTNVYQFSAAKNYQQLKALTQALVDDKGNLRSKSEFRAAAAEINDKHIGAWLDAERNLAIAGGQMCSKWVDIQKNKSYLPLLEFDAIIDGRTTDLCRSLNGIVKPVDDGIWKIYYPPNHFGERSTVRQRSSGKITKTEDIIVPEKIPDMFKTNLAEAGLAFPPGHPYYNGVPQSILDNAVKLQDDGE